ncbi:zinc finger CCCH domain-containing protein 48-like isoform X1 [Diospyros lotus]|uniref:zinc finger CCCH domain-containing protein 48-like isoform X1 n=1 Tax=Diospyros lotus TaxID=55363 RepID=UPI00225679B4|nr:zinc finger CCCH domain-containing protein 48-like isoform X1 [Diospyros lotus]XP_052184646.1 zinc finger CCCH domain-containing protein 48-like isoform X1 [Diospyros lotus]XP_052184647.1 zinc finger CCCH domain-containing protein 48-like isoform X1 [Diospyros lotus]XP_052184648.1 zinc finger CCCH domain-containing protein 48-like isoform X1 [Diospyros lotus]XP_052184649.1 zinc finger CCCH domain-containing protein 48-like isoform X1 [Diospyros lotus]XP_052184650.1 zinc finger CCCH domain-c
MDTQRDDQQCFQGVDKSEKQNEQADKQRAHHSSDVGQTLRIPQLIHRHHHESYFTKSMTTAVARVSERRLSPPHWLSKAGPVNIVCAFWLEGRCNRHPCKFLHALPSELVSALPSKQKQKQKQGHKSRSWHRNLEADKSGNEINSSCSGEGGKRREVCQSWLSAGNCLHGDQDCKYLHSWFYGNGFSLLGKLQGHSEAITGIALPSGSNKLYSGSKDKTLRVWDCHTGQCINVIDMSGEVGCLTSEGPWVFVGLENAVKVWNTQRPSSASEVLTLPTGPVPIGQVHAIDAIDNMLFAGAENGTILAWKFRSEIEIPESATSLKGHSRAVTSLIIGAGMLYSGSIDNTIRVWDVRNLLCVQMLEEHAGAVMSVLCWDRYMLSASLDGTVKAWGIAKEGDLLKTIYSHQEEQGVLKLRGIEDAQGKPILFCSCNDNSVRLYDLPSFAERGRLFAKQEVGAIHAMSPTGLFFTGDASGQITVWKLG